jgi:hypothetical protein
MTTFRVWLVRGCHARIATVTATAADELPAAIEEQVPGSWELRVAEPLLRLNHEEDNNNG